MWREYTAPAILLQAFRQTQDKLIPCEPVCGWFLLWQYFVCRNRQFFDLPVVHYSSAYSADVDQTWSCFCLAESGGSVLFTIAMGSWIPRSAHRTYIHPQDLHSSSKLVHVSPFIDLIDRSDVSVMIPCPAEDTEFFHWCFKKQLLQTVIRSQPPGSFYSTFSSLGQDQTLPGPEIWDCASSSTPSAS